MTSLVDDNGNYLDYPGFDFTLTKQAASIYDFQIKGDVSVNFELPDTSVNRKALGYFGITQVNNPAFSVTTWNVIRNGNKIARGTLAIYDEDKNAKVLHCYFFSGNANWIKLLDFNLKEIDTDKYTVEFTETSINTQSSATSGIIFPIIDYWNYYNKGNNYFALSSFLVAGLGGSTDYINTLWPCLYLSTIVKEISRVSGVKFTGNVLTDKLYSRIILTHDGANIVNPAVFVATRASKVSVQSAQAVVGGVTTKVSLARLISQGSKASYSLSATRWNSDGKYNAVVKGYLSLSVSQIYTVSLYKNGVSYTTYTSTGTAFNFSLQTPTVASDFLEIYINGASNFNVNVSSFVSFSPEGSDNPIINSTNEWIRFCAVAPDMKAIDLIKWLSVTFGAICTFNPISKTVTLTKLDSITDSEDWTQYFKGGTFFYNKVTQNNNVLLPAPHEPDLIDYAGSNNLNFGEMNLQSKSKARTLTDVYTSPIGSTKDAVGLTRPAILWPFIQNVDLEDDVALTYTSVTNTGGDPVFNGTGWPFTPISLNLIVRVVDNKGLYSGYWATDGLNPATATQLKIKGDGTAFVADSTGTIYTQKASKKRPGVRALICVPSTNINAFSAQSNFSMGGTARTTAAYAYFSKPMSGYGVDSFKGSLSFGTPNLPGYTSETLEQAYYNKIGGFFSNPFGKVPMEIPESVFQSYNFSKFVYNSEINRYFFVHSIENYKDSRTQCLVYLLMI